MKKLLSVLAAIGMTATASTAVVACGSSKKTTPQEVDPANRVTLAGTTISPVSDQNIASWMVSDMGGNVNPNNPTITYNGGKDISEVSTDHNWNPSTKILTINLKEGLKKGQYAFNVSFSLKKAVGATQNTVITVIANKDKPTSAEELVQPKETKTNINTDNVASWDISKVGVDVDMKAKPDIEVLNSTSTTNEIDKVSLAENPDVKGAYILKITFNGGIQWNVYQLNVTFKLKNGFDNNPSLTLTAIKNSNSIASQTVTWKNKTAIANGSNQLVWTANTDPNTQVDFSKKPSVIVTGQNTGSNIVAANNGVKWDEDSMTLTVTLRDGVPKSDNYYFSVIFRIKGNASNGHDVSISDPLNGQKKTPTSSETALALENNLPDTASNGDVTWNFKSIGADIDTTNGSIAIQSWDGKSADGVFPPYFLPQWNNGKITFATAGIFKFNPKEHTLVVLIKLKNGFEIDSSNNQPVTVPLTLSFNVPL